MGGFHILLADEFEISEVALHLKLIRYDAVDRDFALNEFLSSRSYIMFHFAVKLSHSGTVPFHLYGLAHEDAALVQRCHTAVTSELLKNPSPHVMVADLGKGNLALEFTQWGIEDLCAWQDGVSSCTYPLLQDLLGDMP